MVKNHNQELLDSFVEYCKKHPHERFWQALRNWSGRGFILVTNHKDAVSGEYEDTFYWKTKDGSRL